METNEITDVDRFLASLRQHADHVKSYADLLEHEISKLDKRIKDLEDQVNVLKLQMKLGLANKASGATDNIPDPGETYDNNEELDSDGRIYPYILPYHGTYRYTRSKFEFLKECSRILVEAGKHLSPISEMCQTLIDAGVPFESVVWSMRQKLSDGQKLLGRPDSEIYPYLRSQFECNFRNPDADFHWLRFMNEVKERKIARKQFDELDAKDIQESVPEQPQVEQEEPSAPVVEEKPVAPAEEKKEVSPVEEECSIDKNLLKQIFIDQAPLDSYEKVMSILDQFHITGAELCSNVFGMDCRVFTPMRRYKKITSAFALGVTNFCGCDVINKSFKKKDESSCRNSKSCKLSAEQIIAIIEKCDKDVSKIREYVLGHGLGFAFVRFSGVFRNFIYKNRVPRTDTLVKINRALGKNVFNTQSLNYPIKSNDPVDYDVLSGKVFHSPFEFKKFLVDNGLSQVYLANQIGVIKQTLCININRCAAPLKKFLLEEYNCTIDW